VAGMPTFPLSISRSQFPELGYPRTSIFESIERRQFLTYLPSFFFLVEDVQMTQAISYFIAFSVTGQSIQITSFGGL
jgi:hypothetical protein